MLIGICDDQKTDAEAIRTLLEAYPQDKYPLEIKIFNSGKALQSSKKRFDILFLAIALEDINGIEIAAHINAYNPATLIIFVSAHSRYITESFHVKAFQYLLKPLNAQVFNEEFTRCLAQYERQQDSFAVHYKNQTTCLKKNEIVYMETHNRIITAYLSNNETCSYYGTIAEEEERLKDNHFIRCHKRCIVNLAYVRSFNHNSVLTTIEKADGQKIRLPLSKLRYETFCIAMQRYLADCGNN